MHDRNHSHGIRTCVRHHFLKRFLLPAADLGIGSIYFYLYTSVTEDKSFIQRGLELPEFTCLMLIGFWECLVFTNLIPSNRNYEDFFQASSIHAGLTDNAFTVQMRAASGITPPAEEIRASENGPFLMEDENTLLKSHSVHGGHFYWMEDITQQKRLNRELGRPEIILRKSMRCWMRRRSWKRSKTYRSAEPAVRPDHKKYSGAIG